MNPKFLFQLTDSSPHPEPLGLGLLRGEDGGEEEEKGEQEEEVNWASAVAGGQADHSGGYQIMGLRPLGSARERRNL